MLKLVAALALCMVSSTALAHEDTFLPIGQDGTLGNLPSSFGPLKVLVGRSSSTTHSIESVLLTSGKFRTKLNPCVLAKFGSISNVKAWGSWYHNLKQLPPYVSIVFYASNGYDSNRPDNDFYAITFSLVDGRILMAERASHNWWGSWRGVPIRPPGKCSGWSNSG